MTKRLHYRSYKLGEDKEWIVFIHGIGGDSRTFRSQLNAFRKHYNLLLPDLRGHGFSKDMPLHTQKNYSLKLIANDVFDLMEHLKIKKAHFMGESFGAIAIRAMDEMNPGKIQSAILPGAVLRLKPSIYFIFKIGKLCASYVNNHFLYRIVAHFIMPRRNHAKSRKIFIQLSKSIDTKEYQSWLKILEEVKKELDLLFNKPFKSPTLLVMGDQDHAFINDARRFCKLNPDTQLYEFKHCGHLSNIERPKEFNKIALDFFKNAK
jgi:pimeloyl-ACP methyl ester carboxylesterase